MRKKKMEILFGVEMIALSICISQGGCGIAPQTSGSNKGRQDTSAGQETVIMRRDGQDIERYDIESYKKQLLPDRESILDCAENYDQEIESVKNTEYKNFSFSSCSFEDMPEFDELYVMMETDHEITTEESRDIIEQWLVDIGKRDLVDMDKEVRIVTSKVEWDESQEYPYCYPALSEHMDLTSGSGAFLDITDCHIQISYDGIYSMSDGKMNSYLKDSSFAHIGALGDYAENVAAYGTVSELSEESYPLISGELTIGEGAELVKSYFEAGTPFPIADGVTINVPDVFVFSLGDVYGYDYRIQRIYKGVPIALGNYKSFNPGTTGMPMEDTKDAYVVDDEGVSAYCGKNASAVLLEVYSDEKMMGVSRAADMLSEKMAPNFEIEVNTVEFLYTPISFDEGNSAVLFPCWMFSGINRVKEEGIVIYVDALTGEIYYYTMTNQDNGTDF